MKAPTKKSSTKLGTEARSTASKLLNGIMRDQETKSPELRAKQERLLQMIATSSLPPTGSTDSDTTGETQVPGNRPTMAQKPPTSSKAKASNKAISFAPDQNVDPPEFEALTIDKEELIKAVQRFASARSPEARLQDRIDLEIEQIRKRSQQ